MTVLSVTPAEVDGVSFTVLGDGLPVTVFAHGLGGSVAETRPLAARAPGTRVLVDFRGHGASADLVDGWDYELLADDLLAVADAVGATRAVGLSLGAGALLRLLSRTPERFEKVVFVLPAALDAARRDGATLRLRQLGEAIDRRDAGAAAQLFLAELPAEVRDRRGVAALLARRAAQLVTKPAPQPRYDDRPLPDRAALAAIRCPALVVGQAGDALHPLVLAQELADELPRARLLALAPGGVFWTAAAQAQTAIADHLLED